ncbi:MAG TPA: tRNA pseudouridine(55) synthase TruB [Nitrospinaceae bacterium]|jgi:tRNA pseudouridine55 synthase|nr:tRNA pseudouridine(55) synthase TruB [Nitrospinaceae bacterium]
MSYTQDSIVNLFKPVGPTSFDMVCSVRKILGVKKAGHIGTLDPAAEGVLPICLNRSTRIIQFLSPLQKTYRATLELGSETDTQDATGRKISTKDPSLVNETKIKQVFQTFVGEKDQIPPMYSAKKKNGIPLYKLARNGINIARDPVKVTIYSIDFIKKEKNQVLFEVRCSAGTYIRTLSHDIGKKLGCYAHMVRLTRTKVGLFGLGRTLTLEELKLAYEEGSLPEKLLPLEEALNFLPAIRVKEEYLESVSHGVALSKCFLETLPDRFEPGHYFRVFGNNDKVVAVVEPVVDQDKLPELTPGDIVFKAKRVLC